MIADTALLLGLRWRMALNTFHIGPAWKRALTVIGVIVLVLVVGGTALGLGYGLGSAVRANPGWGLAALLPGLALTGIALLLLFSSFGTELASLYLTNDLDLLMSAPIDRRAVFISKMLDSVAFSYGVLAFTALPALAAYGLGLRLGPLYYLFMLLAVLLTPLFPAGLGALLVMAVARFAPARRVREVLTAVGIVFSMGCALLGNTTRFWMSELFAQVGNGGEALQALHQLDGLPIPTMIAGRGLVAAGNGDVAGALGQLAFFLVLTGGLFALCVWVADFLYTQGWVRMQSTGSGGGARTAARAARAAAHGGLLSSASPAVAIMLKDWRLIVRDLRIFSQMLWPLLLLPVFYFNLLGGAGPEQSINTVEIVNGVGGGRFDPWALTTLFTILVSTVMVFGTTASIGISLEGSAWWIIKTAPIRAAEILRGKYITVWLPYAVISTLALLVVALWRGFSLAGLLYGWLGLEVAGAGLLAVAVGLAVPWARLDWTNPKQMNSFWGWLATTVVQLVLGLLAGALLVLPVFLAPADGLLAWATHLLGLAGATLVCAGMGGAALAVGGSRLAVIGEK